MRCHYLSDLHLESEICEWCLPKGDILIIAGDLCHARCLDPERTDKYCTAQRGRVQCLINEALEKFPHVLMVAGNHEHYDGVFEETIGLMRRNLQGVTVLDNESVEIGGVHFFGSTLWSSFKNGDLAVMNSLRRRMGEFFFVKTKKLGKDKEITLARFQPEDAFTAHNKACSTLQAALAKSDGKPTVIITHHAPSQLGCNPLFKGNGLDDAYYTDMEQQIEKMKCVPYWIHGHTHVNKRYTIGETTVVSNAQGFISRGGTSRGFSPSVYFDL